MTKLGYTWYPQNWWTSNAFFELEEYPLVRYAYREVLDLLYSKGGCATLTEKTIERRFRIGLSNKQFELLKSLFEIDGDIWCHKKVSSRISKAESSRNNGKKGGRPKNPITQENNLRKNPRNPPLEREREREREREIKEKKKSKIERELIETRKETFRNNLKPFFIDGKISKEDSKDFFEYWTEHGTNDKKMRFEKEKSFGMSRRVSNWLKNKNKFTKSKQSEQDLEDYIQAAINS